MPCRAFPLSFALVAGFASFGCSAGSAEDFPAPPKELSAIELVRSTRLLTELGATEGFWTVGDEGPLDSNFGMFVRSGEDSPWRFVPARPIGPTSTTDDAEALAFADGKVYVVGSQFGGKLGPTKPEKAFFARFVEDEVQVGPEGLAITWTTHVDFALAYGAINDALAESGIELIPRGPAELKNYIEPRNAADRESGMERPNARAINVEGATFLEDGSLLLGLRYPTTAKGHPILIRITGIDGVLSNLRVVPTVQSVWVLSDVGSREEPRGIRALDFAGGMVHAMTGSLDSRALVSTILSDHPEGAKARCVHVTFSPPPAGETSISVGTPVDSFEKSDVEGLALDGAGRVWFVRDLMESATPFQGTK